MPPKEQFNNLVMQNLKANDSYDRFWYRFEFEKKQHRGIIDLSNKDLSKRDRLMVAKKEFLSIKEKVEQGISSDATVNYMVDKYLSTLDEGEYKRDRKSFYDRNVKTKLGNKKISSIMPDHIQSLVDALIKSGYAARTAKQAIEILSPAFRIARANRIMYHNPCEDVKIKYTKTKKIVANASERLKIAYNHIMERYEKDPFFRAFFLLAIQGRRRGEIINLRVEDVDLAHDMYILRDTKNGEEQKIFLPPNVKIALMEFMPKKGYVFTSPRTGGKITGGYKQVLMIRKSIGDWFSLHYLRNIMVSAMAENGVDAIHMSGALGHNDATTINKYLTMNYMKGSRIASNMMDDISK
ncbi:MAG: site-specific integrase [Candidatus Paceibacterota bacterium]